MKMYDVENTGENVVYTEYNYTDSSLLNPLQYLWKLYKFKLEETSDTREIVSGGIQQYINRNQISLLSSSSQEVQLCQVTVEQPKRTQTQATILDLPVNVQLHIMSFLGAADLCRMAQVCHDWSDLTSDNLLWRQRLAWDIKKWSVIGHTTVPSLYREVDSDWTDKEIYLRCSPEINKSLRQQNFHFHQLSSMLRYLLPQKPPMIAMFGPGLESETSGLIRLLMFEKNDNFTTTGMFPGQFRGGFGSGISLKIKNTNFNLTTLYTSNKHERENIPHEHRLQHNKLLVPVLPDGTNSDESIHYELKPYVKDLCRSVDAFVFVVNAKKDNHMLNKDKIELSAMVNERWSAPHVPVLVLSCVRDKTVARTPCIEVVNQLELNQLTRPWQVYDCIVDGLLNVPEAFQWVIEQSHRR